MISHPITEALRLAARRRSSRGRIRRAWHLENLAQRIETSFGSACRSALRSAAWALDVEAARAREGL